MRNRSILKMKNSILTACLMIAGLLLALPQLQAQSYSIGWYKIACGGAAAGGGQYSISGTIGQPDAGGAMSGGNYSLTGGFWSLISVVQTAGLPNLAITHSGNSVIISWPNTANFALQQNSNLAASGSTATSSSSGQAGRSDATTAALLVTRGRRAHHTCR